MKIQGQARLFILTGPVHSGKTTFLQTLSAEGKRLGLGVEGYLSPVVWEGESRIGYDLWTLFDGKSYPFLRVAGEAGWERVGPYYVIPEALALAQKTIRKGSEAELLIVDELGPLELEGSGVWPAVEDILTGPPARLLLTIRDSLLDSFRRKIRAADSAVILTVGDRAAIEEILGRV